MRLKPLYLPHDKGLQVHLDGPALAVNPVGKARTLYPFQRLARVISAQDVSWNGAALPACLSAGVPVIFVDARNQPIGHCYGTTRRETTLDGLLREAIENERWHERYATWLRGKESQLMQSALRITGLRCRRLTVASCRSAFCNDLYKRNHEPVGSVLSALENMLDPVVSEGFAAWITHPAYRGFPRPGLSFVADFTALLRWNVFATFVLERPDISADSRKAQRDLARWLQQRQPAIEVQHDNLFRAFELWLRSWVL